MIGANAITSNDDLQTDEVKSKGDIKNDYVYKEGQDQLKDENTKVRGEEASLKVNVSTLKADLQTVDENSKVDIKKESV